MGSWINKDRRFLWFILILTVLLGAVYAYRSGGIKIPSIAISDLNSPSIKQLSQNPSSYEGKEVSLKGKLNERFGGYSLDDSNGYWVWIGEGSQAEGCMESQRNYNVGQTYSVTGTWTNKSAPLYQRFRLDCNSPID